MVEAAHTPGSWRKVGEFTIRGKHPKGGERTRVIAKVEEPAHA